MLHHEDVGVEDAALTVSDKILHKDLPSIAYLRKKVYALNGLSKPPTQPIFEFT